MPNIIEINGEEYLQLEKQNKGSKLSPTVSKVLMMAIAFSSLNSSNKQKERPEVNIIAEFELIQQKKSKLSRLNRDWVERQFYKNFVKIKYHD